MGGGITEMALVTEEFSRACGGIALAMAGTALGTFPILIAGTEEQKRRHLPVLREHAARGSDASSRMAAWAVESIEAREGES